MNNLKVTSTLKGMKGCVNTLESDDKTIKCGEVWFCSPSCSPKLPFSSVYESDEFHSPKASVNMHADSSEVEMVKQIIKEKDKKFAEYKLAYPKGHKGSLT